MSFTLLPSYLRSFRYGVHQQNIASDAGWPSWSHSLPSSGSSLAQVSAVIRLAMKRCPFLGLLCWLASVELMLELMEEPSIGRLITEQVDEDVGSKVVARCSLSLSTSNASNLTCAVLRGWRSFWTAERRWKERFRKRRQHREKSKRRGCL